MSYVDLNNCIAWLPFDSSSVQDIIQKHEWQVNEGSPTVSSTNAVHGNALQLDGSSSIKTKLVFGHQDFAVYGWVYVDSSSPTNSCIFGIVNPSTGNTIFDLRKNSSNKLEVRVNTNAYARTASYGAAAESSSSVGNLVYVALVYQLTSLSAGTISLYVDGTLACQLTSRPNFHRLRYDFYVGSQGFIGSIDELMIYDGGYISTTPPSSSDYNSIQFPVDAERTIPDANYWAYSNTGTADLLLSGMGTTVDTDSTKSKFNSAFYQTERKKCFPIPAVDELWIKFDVYSDGSYWYAAFNGASSHTGLTIDSSGTASGYVNGNLQIQYYNVGKFNQIQTWIVHMKAGSSNGFLEFWTIEDGDITLGYRYTGNVNGGQPFSDFHFLSHGSDELFSNVLISNSEISFFDNANTVNTVKTYSNLDNCIAWLPFDTSATKNILDWTTWTVESGTPTISNSHSVHGNALQLDGSSAIKTTCYLGGQDFTIDGWVYTDSSCVGGARVFNIEDSSGNTLVQLRHPYSGSGQWRLVSIGSGGIGGNLIAKDSNVNPSGKTMHFAVVYRYDAQTMTFYIDGTQKAQVTGVSKFTRQKFTVHVGCHKSTDSSPYYLTGTIDEFRIYDRAALSASNLVLNQYENINFTLDTSRAIKDSNVWVYRNKGTADSLLVTGYTLSVDSTKSIYETAFYQTSHNKCFDIPNTDEIWMKFDVYFNGSTRWRAFNNGESAGRECGISSYFYSGVSGSYLVYFSYDNIVKQIYGICKHNQIQTWLLHMVKGSTDGIIEAWTIDENDKVVYTGKFVGNVNSGNTLSKILLQSDGSGTMFSNVIISNSEIGFDEVADVAHSEEILLDVARNTECPVEVSEDAERQIVLGQQFSLDSEREVSCSVSLSLDAERNVIGNCSISFDLERNLSAEASLDCDSERDLYIGCSLSLDSERDVSANASLSCDSERKLSNEVEVTVDVERVSAQQEPVIVGDVSFNVDTWRLSVFPVYVKWDIWGDRYDYVDGADFYGNPNEYVGYFPTKKYFYLPPVDEVWIYIKDVDYDGASDRTAGIFFDCNGEQTGFFLDYDELTSEIWLNGEAELIEKGWGGAVFHIKTGLTDGVVEFKKLYGRDVATTTLTGNVNNGEPLTNFYLIGDGDNLGNIKTTLTVTSRPISVKGILPPVGEYILRYDTQRDVKNGFEINADTEFYIPVHEDFSFDADTEMSLEDSFEIDADTEWTCANDTSFVLSSERAVYHDVFSASFRLDGDTELLLGNSDISHFDTFQIIGSNCAYNFDTEAEYYRKADGVYGIVTCRAINLRKEYDIQAAVNVVGEGYARIRYAKSNKQFGSYEDYKPKRVTCQYIQVQLVVRNKITAATMKVIPQTKEVTITRTIAEGGSQISYGTSFCNTPSIFPAASEYNISVSSITNTGCFVRLTQNGVDVEGSISLMVKGS